VKEATAYRPRPRRDRRVPEVFWQGVYYGISVGLLVGAAVWGLLLLGGAPLATDRVRALVTLAGCGAVGAAVVCSWVWGRRGLQLADHSLPRTLGDRLQWLMWLFVGGEDEAQREERVQAAARTLASRILAGPVGVPVMVVLGATGKAQPLAPAGLVAVSGLGTLAWALLLVAWWQWLIPPAPPTAVGPSPAQIAMAQARAEREQARLDSALQLAVARARRAKKVDKVQEAISILEQALQQAEAQGRSVAHLELHWMLAWLYADTGNLDGAIVMFKTVLELAEPGSTRYTEAQAAIDRLMRKAGYITAGGEADTRILQEDLDRSADEQRPD